MANRHLAARVTNFTSDAMFSPPALVGQGLCQGQHNFRPTQRIFLFKGLSCPHAVWERLRDHRDESGS